MKKKMFGTLTAFLLALVFVLTGSDVTCNAAEMTNLTCGQEITDSLETSDDVNYYAFTVDKTGYFTISFTKVDPTLGPGWGWDVALCDMDGNYLREYRGQKNTFSTAKLNYRAGTRLYLKVDANYTSSAPTGQAYKIKVNTVADGSWEQEYNDTTATAMPMASNVNRIGTLISGSDADYYAYTVEKTGYFTFDFRREDPTLSPGWGWDMDIYDTAGNLLCEYNGIKSNFSTQKLNFKTGTKLYVKISANYSNSSPTDQIYFLQASAVAKKNWEVETVKYSSDTWSSRIKNAATLSGTKRYGSLWESSDNDVYKLKVSKTGKVTLKFYPNNTEDNVGWGYDIGIYKKNGDKAVEYEQIKTDTTKTFYAKKGTYYVVVSANYSRSAPSSYDSYAITAKSKSASVSSMKSKKISYTTKTATLKWKKVKNVHGYEIQICPNKKFKKSSTKVYTTTETSYKLGWTVPRGTHYVRIRAYVDLVTGDKLYGKYTKVKKVMKK